GECRQAGVARAGALQGRPLPDRRGVSLVVGSRLAYGASRAAAHHRLIMKHTIPFLILLCCGTPLCAGGKPSPEDEYYKLLRYEIPQGAVLEAGAIAPL